MKTDTIPFYKNGLRFTCTRCSNCCRHDAGYVFLSQHDVDRLAGYFRMTGKDFISTYCRRVDFNTITRTSLIEKTNFDCIFWSDETCMVYKYRPLQCRMYPFWQHNLVNRAVWDSVGEDCPGINHGKNHTYRKIQKILRRREFEPFLS